jgi:hypothetical protein
MSAEKNVDSVESTAPTEEVNNMAQAAEAMFEYLDGESPQPDIEPEQTEEESESQPVEDEEDVSEEEGEYEEEDEEYNPEDNRDAEGEDTEVYTVMVNGEEVEVDIEELRNGYSRQSDYTRKTQEIAEERKKMEEAASVMLQQQQDIQQVREQYINQIGQFVNQGMAGLRKYAGVDWARLKEEDPIEYVTKRDEFREEQEKIRFAQAQQQQAIAQQNQQFEQAKAELIQMETQKLSEAIPEWTDPEQRTQLAGKLRGYASQAGYEKEEIDNLVDSRSVQVLIKAMKYDELQKAKPKKLKGKSNRVKPGAGKTTKAAREKRTAKMQSLKRTGDVKTAASLIEDLL